MTDRPWMDDVVYCEEDRSAHTLDGAPVLGVTSAIRLSGASFDFDTVRESDRLHRATLGQAVHLAAHYHDEGDLDEASLPEVVVNGRGNDVPGPRVYLAGWTRFRAERRFVPELLETIVASRQHRFIGRLDRIGRVDGSRRRILLDIKLGDPDDCRADLQTSAYELAVLEELASGEGALFLARCPGIAVEPLERWSVQLRADGTYRLGAYPCPRRSDLRDRADFLQALKHAYQTQGVVPYHATAAVHRTL